MIAMPWKAAKVPPAIEKKGLNKANLSEASASFLREYLLDTLIKLIICITAAAEANKSPPADLDTSRLNRLWQNDEFHLPWGGDFYDQVRLAVQVWMACN